MFVSIYYKPSLFNAHTMILIVHIFMNVNTFCLNQQQQNVLKLWMLCFLFLMFWELGSHTDLHRPLTLMEDPLLLHDVLESEHLP